MALQVWLPLNGNTNNQGLSNSSVTNNGAIVNDSGKIGKCYSFTESQYLSLNNVSFSILTNCSVCFWMYLNSNQDWLPCTGGSNGSNTGQYFLATGGNNGAFYHSGVGSNVITIYCDGKKVTNPSTAGAWHHYCITGLDLSTWTGMAINHFGDYGSWNFDGKLNDFRIYDHCLSPKEVKEISKGLVLHYKMDDKIATNLVKNHTYNIYDNYGVPTSLIKLSETFQGCDVYRLTMTPTSASVDSFKVDLWSHGIYGFSNVTFKANTKYCFWIYYRPVSHPDVRVGGTASNISGWYEIPPTEYGSGWKVVGQYRDGSVTSDKIDNIFTSFCTPSATVGTPITIDFCCPHLIEGSSEIIDDGDYQETNAHTTVYDCSGFGNNGQTSAIAPISDSDSSRYSSCFNFDTNAKCITTAIDPTGYKDTYSITWWGNIPSFSRAMFWGFNNMMNWYAGRYWNQGDGADNPFYSSGTTTIEIPSTNIWHHYVITGDGSTTKLYVDGVLYGIAKTYRAIGGTSLQINGWPYDTDYRISGMKMSDFRIYATPLSAEDVKELYNTSTVICDNGTVMTYSLEE